MQRVNLYRYEESNGVVTVTPKPKAKTDTPSLLRLVADEGYVLTNGETNVPAIDIEMENVELWSEIVESDGLSETNLKAQAYNILMGVNE